ncbi:MAG TPA: hypothetical protein VJI98_04685 [Candidatus Nanoarchaeia archaeon]|nr:hypothetical protein [Candidatus Nanoarchaeia archaeon]
MVLKSVVMALALYATLPSDSPAFKIKVDEGRRILRYDLMRELGIFGISVSPTDVGDAEWVYSADIFYIRSNFRLRTSDREVQKLLGAEGSSITSISSFDNSDDGVSLDEYIYRQYNRGKLSHGLKLKKQLSGTTVVCENYLGVVPCLSTPASPAEVAADLFTILAGIAHIKDLEAKVAEGKFQPAFYNGRQYPLKLVNAGKEARNGVKVNAYDVLGVDYLLEKPGELKVRIWLRYEYPHLLEALQLEAKIPKTMGAISGVLTVERKE